MPTTTRAPITDLKPFKKLSLMDDLEKNADSHIQGKLSIICNLNFLE